MAVADVVTLVESSGGWLVVLLWIAYQLYWPGNTKLSTLVGRVEARIDRIEQLQTMHIQVTRAQARIQDDMDADAVDQRLVDKGVDPDEFLCESPPADTDRGAG